MAFWCLIAPATAADVNVMASGGFAMVLGTLTPIFEQGVNHLTVIRGPSMGATSDAVPAGLDRGERCDVLVMVRPALDRMHEKGLAGDCIVLAMLRIGVVVKAGAPHPVIDSALRQALLDAPSIAYLDSASGDYVSRTLFRRLGIKDQVKAKAHQIPETPVAQVVAQGRDTIGFQQLSEILPVKGASLVGPIPESLQKLTPIPPVCASMQPIRPEAAH